MNLQKYNQKREFGTTPEPEGIINDNNGGRFVIQRHQARRLHYDLRLEMDGVLKSWAVPKGPSMNPADKRLAVQTEDHPVKYLTFRGTIPKGNYGAGEMKIWDEGTFRPSQEADEKDLLKQLEDGNLKLEFFGSRIKGTFALVHTSLGKEENNWLLIKKKDAYATDLKYDAELITPFEVNERGKNSIKKIRNKDLVLPMLASSAKKIFNDPNWIYELKWDGYRALANCESGKVRLYSRNGISFNKKFPSIAEALSEIPHEVILDGEIVITDKNGVSHFQKLQLYDPKNTSGTLQYYIFDMLFLNGHSMLNLPLLERKNLIPDVINNISGLVYCDHIEGMGTAFYKRALELGMEGVIAKKANSLYFPGTRNENWLKIKKINTLEAIICGYTESVTSGSVFGSLILGMYKDDILIYIGNCGSGFSDREQKILLKHLEEIEIKKNPFSKKINLKGRKPHWVDPLLICEVKFSEWTRDGRLRHPVYKGLRTDKITSEITTEQTKYENPEVNRKAQNNVLEVDGISVPLTNLNKVFWPASGLTKYDLIEYYIRISDYILPYLKDRPQNLHRHPNGINKNGFYQKDNKHLPDWVATSKIYSKSAKKNIEYLMCQNEATLLYMANLGCIEINPWNSRISKLDKPDYTVIDLDPSENNSFEDVIEVALAVKEVLDSVKIKGYCKTSGSSGLHIYLPLGARYSYDEAFAFTKLLCYFIHEKLPKLTSMERIVKRRKGKVYLDYMQNKRGQTLAAPYCLRPKEYATASAPLEWKEVKSGLKILDFTIHSLPERIKKKGDLFTPVLLDTFDMEKAIESLNGF
jgi:bifunctional non-homologous end joining protein LigD